MSNKIEEDQLDFIGELLGDAPVQAAEPVEEPTQVEEVSQVEEPTQNEEVTQTEAAPQQEEPEQDINAILREQIVKLTEQLQSDPLVQSVQSKVEDKEQPKQKPSQQSVLKAFLSEEEIDRVIDEPQLLNKAFERAIGSIEQSMQRAIQAEVNRQVMVSRAVSDFYTSHEDLAPYGKFVQFVMSEVEKSNPDKTYAEIFQMTANESRKRLGLGAAKVQERQQSQPRTQRPAFAGGKSGNARPAARPDFFDPNAADMLSLP